MTERSLPAGATQRFIDTNAGRLSVLHGGSSSGSPPAVLIHGGGYDNAAISWWRLFAPLAADREVWAPDLPGFGGSIDLPPLGGPHRMAVLIAELLGRLDLPPAVVFGVSMGGDVGLNLALARPERVAALVLIAPGGLTPRLKGPATQWAAWLAAQTPDWLLRPATRLANRFAGAALRSMVRDPATLPAEVVDAFVAEARHPQAGLAYARYNQATLGPRGMRNDLSGRVGEVAAPVLLVHGESDPLVDPVGSRIAAANMRDARLVLVPDCGHWAQLEAHDLFLAETRRFLGRLAQA